MKLETAAFLDKARDCLAKADGMLGRWPDEAGREAYLAGPAQASIVEVTGEVMKRHRGVQSELARLTKYTPQFEPELRAVLGRTHNLKAIADYEIGPDAKVSPGMATHTIETARRFVARMA